MNLEIGNNRISANLGDNWQTLDIEGADIIHDLETFPYPIPDNKYEIIYMSHVLEHIRWYEAERVLKELYRILKPGGKLEIWVPDFGKIIEGYLSGSIPEEWSIYNKDRDFMKWVNGRLFSYGTTENLHKACYDAFYLAKLLRNTGFKLVAKLNKPRGIDHGYINLGMQGVK